MRKMVKLTVILLTCMLMSGCIKQELKETDYDEDFVVTDFDLYVENLFGITEAIYSYDNIGNLYHVLEKYMEHLNLSYDNNELKELAYHILEKAPNYIGTQESNIRTVITLEYILTSYRDMELTKQETILKEALEGVQGVYLHTYTGGKVSSEQVMLDLEKSEEIHSLLKEEEFYGKRESIHN